MLGSNAFFLNDGLVCGVDHVPSEHRAEGPPRHMVARALEGCRDLDHAIDFLSHTPSAAGFAYNMAERSSGRVATAEAGGGAWGAARGGPSGGGSTGNGPTDGEPVLWHTNHLRHAPSLRQVRCARGAVLAAVAQRRDSGDLDAGRVTDLLTTPLPLGVRAEGSTVTLCTVVCDGASGATTLVPRGGGRVSVPTDALLACVDEDRADCTRDACPAAWSRTS